MALSTAPDATLAPRPAAVQSRRMRIACGLGAAAWLVVALWLLAGAPATGRWLGAGWLALSALWPAGYFYSLAVALAWFGNNPGGPHHLYLLELALIGLVGRHLLERAMGRIEPRPGPLDRWVWLLVAWSWLTLAGQARWIWVELYFTRSRFLFENLNHYVTSPTFGLQCALKLTLAAGLYVVLRDRPWSERAIARWLTVALAVLGASAVAGLLNYLGLLPLDWWRGENPYITRFGFSRLQSLYWHSGWYAQYIAALAPAALAMAWIGTRRRWATAACWGLAGLLALAMLLSMQRAGWLALGAGYGAVALAAAWTARRGGGDAPLASMAWRLGAALGVLAAMGLVLALLSEEFSRRAAELAAPAHRIDNWRGAFQMIRLHPLSGVGLGNHYPMHLLYYFGDHPLAAVQDKGTAHNLYLHLWAERGLVGLILMLGAWFGAMWLLWRRMNRAADPLGRAVAAGLLAGLAALAVNGWFQYVFYVRTIELIVWLMIGWAAGMAGAARVGRRMPAWFWLVLILAGAGVVGYENRMRLIMPWTIWVEDKNYRVGGDVKRLALPPGADRVRLWLASIDPDNPREPVRMEVMLGGELVAEAAFPTQTQRELLIDLPPGARRGPLLVRASRSWAPFLHGDRRLPLTRIGVMYRPPEPVRD